MTDRPKRRHEGLMLDGRLYVDRYTLAAMFNRSVHTIRARCPVAIEHTNDAGKTIRTLFDVQACAVVLAAIPTRPRRPVDQRAGSISDFVQYQECA